MPTIEDLKSLISKKGGVARPNRFNVIFTPPTQSLLNINPQQIFSSLISKNFSAKNLINDPRDISILCTAASLPGRQISTLDYQAEKQTVKIPYTVIDEEVTLKFIITNDYYIKTMMDSWVNSIIDLEDYTVGYKRETTADVVIQQLDEKNTPIYGVKLINAFPTTISSVELGNENENSIQELSVTMSYDKYVPEGPLSSTGSALRAALDIFG
jgi:hypothetical protein